MEDLILRVVVIVLVQIDVIKVKCVEVQIVRSDMLNITHRIDVMSQLQDDGIARVLGKNRGIGFKRQGLSLDGSTSSMIKNTFV